MKICATEGCHRETKHGTFCSTCRSRKSRAKDPIAYIFNNIHNRANQRKKEFTITLPYFRQWCIDNDFRPGIDSVDRKENEFGYIPGNLNKLPLIQNIRKYWDWDRKRKGMAPITDEELNTKIENIESGWKPVETESF